MDLDVQVLQVGRIALGKIVAHHRTGAILLIRGLPELWGSLKCTTSALGKAGDHNQKHTGLRCSRVGALYVRLGLE